MFDRDQFRELITDVLQALDLASPVAADLLMGTAAQESRLGTYLRQNGKGPALGVFQMEPATERDLWDNYLVYNPVLVAKLTAACGVRGPGPHLRWNLAYQIAMARLHYRRVKEPLPATGDVLALAGYWKRYYNTTLGKGTVEEFEMNYRRLVLGKA